MSPSLLCLPWLRPQPGLVSPLLSDFCSNTGWPWPQGPHCPPSLPMPSHSASPLPSVGLSLSKFPDPLPSGKPGRPHLCCGMGECPSTGPPFWQGLWQPSEASKQLCCDLAKHAGSSHRPGMPIHPPTHPGISSGARKQAAHSQLSTCRIRTWVWNPCPRLSTVYWLKA